jgi:hypothetical protein
MWSNRSRLKSLLLFGGEEAYSSVAKVAKDQTYPPPKKKKKSDKTNVEPLKMFRQKERLPGLVRYTL